MAPIPMLVGSGRVMGADCAPGRGIAGGAMGGGGGMWGGWPCRMTGGVAAGVQQGGGMERSA